MNGSLFDVDSVKEAMLNPFKVCSYGRYISEEKENWFGGTVCNRVYRLAGPFVQLLAKSQLRQTGGEMR